MMKLEWLLLHNTVFCLITLQADAPLAIRPMLPNLTKSEIHAVMTGGFATIAGSVLAAYIIFGVSFVSSFSARQHIMQSALYAIVRPSHGQMDQNG